MRGALFLLAFLLSPTFARADDPTPLTRREKGDLAIEARAILRKYCHECHGGAANRGTITVLDHGKVIATGPNPVPFVAPNNVAASQVIQFIEDGSMPPGGRDRPGEKELTTLKKWVAAAAPSYPVSFDEDGTLKAMLDDLARRPPDDAKHLRYISFAHLIRDDKPADLKAEEGKLLRAFTWCGVTTAPEPVDDTATLFRLDLRTARWESRELFVRSVKGAAGDLHPLSIHDLLLLEYPHATRFPGDHPQAKRLGNYFTQAQLARPVPYLRGEWVAEQLAKGTPLADDVRGLSELTEALRKQEFPRVGDERNMPTGPATRAFGGKNPVPGAAKSDVPGTLLPLTAWYAGDCQPDPPPFQLTAEVVNEKGESIASVVKGSPFKLKVTADRGVHFVLLLVWADGTVKVQPTNRAGFITAGESLLTPDSAGAFRITDILTGQPSASEYFVLLASTSEVPTPSIVRSRHTENPERLLYPVHRFVFDPNATIDPSRAVRKVIPITVTEK